ncbi:MAG: ankyrin repeat domain-containing protein [Waddliaceae bacterium]
MSVSLSNVDYNKYLTQFLTVIGETEEYKIDEIDCAFLEKRQEVALRSGEVAIRCFHVLFQYVNHFKKNAERTVQCQKVSEISLNDFEKLKYLINSTRQSCIQMIWNRFFSNPNELDYRPKLVKIWIRVLASRKWSDVQREEIFDLLISRGFINVVDRKGTTPLHQACQEGDTEVVHKLIHAKASLYPINCMGMTPLHLAVSNGHKKVVDILINAGMQVDIPLAPFSPLYLAIQKGYTEIAKTLIQAGARINFFSEGISALHLAVINDNLELVITLINAGANVNLYTLLSFTPLYMAALNGNAEIVNVLIQAGAGIDLGGGGFSPLYCAALCGNKEVVDVLIRANVNVNLSTKNGHTPLYVAAMNGNIDLVNALIKAGAHIDHERFGKLSPYYIAVKNGQVEVLKALMHAGDNLNEKSSEKWTQLLCIAAYKGHLPVVNTLLEAGAHINDVLVTGLFALYLAAEYGHVEVLVALINAGANVNARKKDGATPLCVAACNGHLSIVTTLIKAGAVVNVCDKWTPLHLAAQNGHHEVVDVLINAGVCVNGIDKWTPLHRAAENGHYQVVEVLINGGAHLNGFEGWTPLHLSALYGHLEVVKLLLKAGAKIDTRGYEGVTPYDLAVHSRNKEIIEFILSVHTATYFEKLHCWMLYYNVDEADQVLINKKDLAEFIVDGEHKRLSLCSGRGPSEYNGSIEIDQEIKEDLEWSVDLFQPTSLLPLLAELSAQDSVDALGSEDDSVSISPDMLLEEIQNVSQVKMTQGIRDRIIQLSSERTEGGIPLRSVVINYLRKGMYILQQEDEQKIEGFFASLQEIINPSCKEGVYNRIAEFLAPFLNNDSIIGQKLHELKRTACLTALFEILNDQKYDDLFNEIANRSLFEINSIQIKNAYINQTIHFLPAVSIYLGNRLGFSKYEGERDYFATKIYEDFFYVLNEEFFDLVKEKLSQPEVVKELVIFAKQTIESQLNALEAEMIKGKKTVDDFNRFKSQFTQAIKKYLRGAEFGDLIQADDEGNTIVSNNLVIAMLMDQGLIRPKIKIFNLQ